MRVKRLLGLSALILAGSLGATSPNERPRLTYYGLGDIKIGMTETQAKKLGFKLTTAGPWSEVGDDYYVSCHYIDSSSAYPGIALMISDKRVVRIDVNVDPPGGHWKSHSGLGLEMTEDEAGKIYGKQLKTSGHPYQNRDEGSYLTMSTRDGRYAMIFETSSTDELGNVIGPRRVISFRAGYAEPVGYIEGCA